MQDWNLVKQMVGKTIERILMDDSSLYLHFTDGITLEVFDDMQCCNESRYMTCDDDLPYYHGAQFFSLEIREGDGVDDGDDYNHHENMFLEVTTSRGCFTVETHNVHNGYYGGFNIVFRKGSHH